MHLQDHNLTAVVPVWEIYYIKAQIISCKKV